MAPHRIVFGLALLAACSSTEPGPPQQLTALPRELSANERRIATASNQFTLTLLKRLVAQQPTENVFVSPLSVSFSLGMALNGAAGSTLDEMRSTLGFGGATLQEINDGYKSLMGLERGLDPSTTFLIANSVWHRQSLPVTQSFVDNVKQTFDAEVRASPFDATTVTQVNAWVSDKTNGKIPKIMDSISPELVMFLINAIYFKGSWREQFDKSQTRDSPFAALGGEQTVKMMSRKEAKMPFAFTSEYVAGDLVYGNSAFVMTVVVPRANAVNAFAAALDTALWSGIIADLHEGKAPVQFPKLTLEYERQLKDDLTALGMVTPFDEVRADFSNMSPVGADMYISFVKHKTFVQIDEEGTEAAAVTNTGIGLTSAPPCLCADRPFVFAIRERFSGTILFMGRIVRIP